mmetsp:Transcript_12912/g.35739  ORF Transcript_12912/g.35739 Transcript_12912/m.35739 type:complete len:254 (-) Transcript_12912:237-998(-)
MWSCRFVVVVVVGLPNHVDQDAVFKPFHVHFEIGGWTTVVVVVVVGKIGHCQQVGVGAVVSSRRRRQGGGGRSIGNAMIVKLESPILGVSSRHVPGRMVEGAIERGNATLRRVLQECRFKAPLIVAANRNNGAVILMIVLIVVVVGTTAVISERIPTANVLVFVPPAGRSLQNVKAPTTAFDQSGTHGQVPFRGRVGLHDADKSSVGRGSVAVLFVGWGMVVVGVTALLWLHHKMARQVSLIVPAPFRCVATF